MNSYRNSESGISLIEVLLVTTLGAFIFLAVGELMVFLKKGLLVTDGNFRALQTEMVGSRALWFDITNSGVGFNVLGFNDENGRGFWDYLKDQPCPETLDACRRRITLTPQNGASFVLMKEDSKESPSQAIQVARFYDQTEPAPGSFTAAGTVTLNETRMKDILATKSATTWSPNGTLREPFALIQFYSVSLERQMPAAGLPNFNEAPRAHSYMGYWDGGDTFQSITTLPGAPISDQRHPVTDNQITSLDNFFRTMPPQGGDALFTMVRRVSFVRYSVEALEYEGYQTGRLMRSTFDPAAGGWSQPQTVAVPICGIELARRSINMPSVRPTVYEDKSTLNRRVTSKSEAIGSSCRRDAAGNVVIPNSFEF
ncbi:MAG: hypothetical protein H6617_08840 [Bdellovibrionaceae bacterium]|nr:hypothetical protein [Bdellovibrionales bacterium]MCB9254773.1 hypothetical protein [Pseudobdellovibrionaceae bacterium]